MSGGLRSQPRGLKHNQKRLCGKQRTLVGALLSFSHPYTLTMYAPGNLARTASRKMSALDFSLNAPTCTR